MINMPDSGSWLRRVYLLVGSAMLCACAASPGATQLAVMRNQVPISVAGNDLISRAESDRDASTWPAANWWTQYQDNTLNALIAQALSGAPTLASAEARFANARELVRLVDADGLQINANADASRQRLSDNGLFSPKFLGFNWYNQADLGLRGSYAFDWWHKRRDTVAAALNDARTAQAQRDAVAMSLSISIAQSYFGWQADQTQLSILTQQQQLAEKRRDIIKARVTAQLEPNDGVYSADAEIAGLHEAIVSGQYSAQLRRVAIAALLGIRVDDLPAFVMRSLPIVAARVADNVSIDLLARRADINASRWQVEAAQQRLHAARAEFYPDVSVNALLGLSSIEFGKLLQAGSAVPSLGAAIHLPIFDSGRLRAQYGVRAAQVNLAINAYNEAVVNAAREVTTYAMQLQQLAAQRNDRQLQRDAANHLLEIALLRNQQGLSDARLRLQASQSLQQQQLALTSLDAAMVTTQLNLILALGGGYQGGGYQSTDDQVPKSQSSNNQSIHADAVATAVTIQ